MLDQLNSQTAAEAQRELLACCAASVWAAKMTAARPFPDTETLFGAADAELAALTWEGILEALEAHPRIGDRAAGSTKEAQWSRAEQASAGTADEQLKLRIAEGNRAYEQRYGRVFLICATGLSSEQILDALTTRLRNDEDTEREIVREELRRIVRLRLEKLVSA